MHSGNTVLRTLLGFYGFNYHPWTCTCLILWFCSSTEQINISRRWVKVMCTYSLEIITVMWAAMANTSQMQLCRREIDLTSSLFSGGIYLLYICSQLELISIFSFSITLTLLSFSFFCTCFPLTLFLVLGAFDSMLISLYPSITPPPPAQLSFSLSPCLYFYHFLLFLSIPSLLTKSNGVVISGHIHIFLSMCYASQTPVSPTTLRTVVPGECECACKCGWLVQTQDGMSHLFTVLFWITMCLSQTVFCHVSMQCVHTDSLWCVCW